MRNMKTDYVITSTIFRYRMGVVAGKIQSLQAGERTAAFTNETIPHTKKQELANSKQQQELVNYYEARQITANADYGVFAQKEFEYSDFRVSEIITGFGRLTHKKMQELGLKYGFQTVCGFTDSIFVRHNNAAPCSLRPSLEAGSKTEQNINQYLDDCHNELGVRIDHKNLFFV